MFKKKIKRLTEQKKLRENDLKMLHETPADPMMAEMYRSDLLTEIMLLDEEIEFEHSMLPIRYAFISIGAMALIVLMYSIFN